MTSIYLAGKIRKNDWRNSRDVLVDEGGSALPPWADLAHSIGRLEVTGPFSVGCDHGCTHNQGTHAARGGCTTWESVQSARKHVYDQCFDAIKRADIFFAWLDDDLTAYGTLVEIGQAHGLGKPIVLGVPAGTMTPAADGGRLLNPDFDNLWYAAQCADRIIEAADPASAIAELAASQPPS